MINAEQLKADEYVIEYWFNVYASGHGFRYSSRENCEEAAFYTTPNKPLYRIHVRLK